jgi:histidyl-tRNA synthetase
MSNNRIPKVMPRTMIEALIGEKLKKETYRIEASERDLRVQYNPTAPMSRAHWLITLSDDSTVMVLDEGK